MDCGQMNDCTIRLPNEDNKWLSFKNHCRKERMLFIIYANLECILEKTETEETSSHKYQYHRVFSIAYNILLVWRFIMHVSISFGKDCVVWFVEELRVLTHNIKSILSANVPMEFTRDDLEKFNNATHCHICEKPFAPNDTRVRDHLTGRFRGPAHSNYNINYKDSHCIPVVFHHLSGYDVHFIIKEKAIVYDGRIELLPITKEKYISFTKNVQSIEDERKKKNNIKLRFIDSYKFLTSSLDKFASYLSKYKLRIMQREFSKLSAKNFDLLIKAFFQLHCKKSR